MIKIHSAKVIEDRPYGANIILPPDYPHKSTFYKISYFCDCECDVEFYSRNGGSVKRYSLQKGDAFLISPKDIHHFFIKDSKGYLQKDIYIFPDMMKEICDFISPTLYDEINNCEYPLFYKLSSSSLLSANDLHSNLLYKLKNDETDKVYKVLVCFLLGQYIESKNVKNLYPSWLHELLENIHKEEFLTKSTEEILKTVNYSHGHVCRLFQKYLGMSLKTYVLKVKLAYSCNILTTTNKTLEEITDKLNFSTVSNYILLFKKEYGITPGKYRKEYSTV